MEIDLHYVGFRGMDAMDIVAQSLSFFIAFVVCFFNLWGLMHFFLLPVPTAKLPIWLKASKAGTKWRVRKSAQFSRLTARGHVWLPGQNSISVCGSMIRWICALCRQPASLSSCLSQRACTCIYVSSPADCFLLPLPFVVAAWFLVHSLLFVFAFTPPPPHTHTHTKFIQIKLLELFYFLWGKLLKF